MKTKIILAVMLPLFTTPAYRQDILPVDPSPYFCAVVVKNIDSSSAWYQSVLGLKIKSRVDDPSTGFKIIMLESPTFLMELLENTSLQNSKKIQGDRQQEMYAHGFFKIGFKVTSVDAYIDHLKDLHITVEHVYSDASHKKNFLVSDPDGNLIQFYD